MDNLVKRAFLFLEKGNFEKADEYCERVLDADCENARAYLGKLMVERKVQKVEELVNCSTPLTESDNYDMIMRFGDQVLRGEIMRYNKAILASAEERRMEEEYTKAGLLMLQNKSSAFLEAREILLALGDYKDSIELSEQCAENAEIYRDIEQKKSKKQKENKKKTLKIALKCAIAAVIAAVIAIIVIVYVVPPIKYNKAMELIENGQYGEGTKLLMEISDYKDARAQISRLGKRISAGWGTTLGVKSDGTVAAIGRFYYENKVELAKWKDIIAVSGIAGLKSDGTVVTVDTYGVKFDVSDWENIVDVSVSITGAIVGVKSDGSVVVEIGKSTIPYMVEDDSDAMKKAKESWQKLNLERQTASEWKDIVAVSAGYAHTVGLKSDGTVVAVGIESAFSCEQYNVGDWNDIVAVSAGNEHTVGLKSDGTVVAVGVNEDGQCNVGNWADIVAISAGRDHTVGVKSDGTVVAVGDNEAGKCNVGDWADIVAISAGQDHTVGVKSDGTVVAVGENNNQQCNVYEWKDIKDISHKGRVLKSDGTVIGYLSTDNAFSDWNDIIEIDDYAGLKSDGTVVVVGNNTHGQCNVSEWKDIVEISARQAHTVGLKSDGTVVATGNNDYGQCNVSEWSNIVAVSTSGSITVGLKSDGTVVAVGNNKLGQCDEVNDWNNIVAVETVYSTVLGLKSDGTVVIGEENLPFPDTIAQNIREWTDITALSVGSTIVTGETYVVGLKSDGTVVTAGVSNPETYAGECDVSQWRDIVEIKAGRGYTMGKKADGTVVAVGSLNSELLEWDLF